jgi:hypothetical protein
MSNVIRGWLPLAIFLVCAIAAVVVGYVQSKS